MLGRLLWIGGHMGYSHNHPHTEPHDSPAVVLIGLIVRGLPEAGAEVLPGAPSVPPEVIIPHSHTVIESNDHVVFFLPHKRLVPDVEKLFRVSATFF